MCNAFRNSYAKNPPYFFSGVAYAFLSNLNRGVSQRMWASRGEVQKVWCMRGEAGTICSGVEHWSGTIECSNCCVYGGCEILFKENCCVSAGTRRPGGGG